MASTAPVEEVQIRGVRDNASAQGIVTTEQVLSQLIPVDFSWDKTTMQALGSGASVSFQSAVPYNPVSGVGIQCNPGSTAQNVIKIWHTFKGRKFGIRFANMASSFTVSVDGNLADPIKTPETYMSTYGISTGIIHECYQITHTDLPPGEHVAIITCTTNQSVLLTGMLLDENEYNIKAKSVQFFSQTIAVPFTSGTAAFITPGAQIYSGVAFKYINKIIYTNTTGAAITLNISYNGGSSYDFQYSIPANGVQPFDYAIPISPNAIVHYASATGLKYVALGSYN